MPLVRIFSLQHFAYEIWLILTSVINTYSHSFLLHFSYNITFIYLTFMLNDKAERVYINVLHYNLLLLVLTTQLLIVGRIKLRQF